MRFIHQLLRSSTGVLNAVSFKYSLYKFGKSIGYYAKITVILIDDVKFFSYFSFFRNHTTLTVNVCQLLWRSIRLGTYSYLLQLLLSALAAD